MFCNEESYKMLTGCPLLCLPERSSIAGCTSFLTPELLAKEVQARMSGLSSIRLLLFFPCWENEICPPSAQLERLLHERACTPALPA